MPSVKRNALTREPLPPPFPIGTRVRYLGRHEVSTQIDGGPSTLIKYHGMVATIARVVAGRRGTGRQLRDEDGPMFYEDDSEPILDTTRDGYSVYVVLDKNGREHGRAIQHDTKHEWEIVA